MRHVAREKKLRDVRGCRQLFRKHPTDMISAALVVLSVYHDDFHRYAPSVYWRDFITRRAKRKAFALRRQFSFAFQNKKLPRFVKNDKGRVIILTLYYKC